MFNTKLITKIVTSAFTLAICTSLAHAENPYTTIVNEPVKTEIKKIDKKVETQIPKTSTSPSKTTSDVKADTKPVVTDTPQDNDVYLIRNGQKIGKIPAADWDKIKDASPTPAPAQSTQTEVTKPKEEPKLETINSAVTELGLKPNNDENKNPEEKNKFGKLDESLTATASQKAETKEVCVKNSSEYEQNLEFKKYFARNPFSAWLNIEKTHNLKVNQNGQAEFLRANESSPIKKGKAFFCLENKKISANIFGKKMFLDQYGRLSLDGITLRASQKQSNSAKVVPAASSNKPKSKKSDNNPYTTIESNSSN